MRVERLIAAVLLALVVCGNAAQTSQIKDPSPKPADATECAACVAVVTAAQQYGNQHHITHEKVFDELCTLFFKKHAILRSICTEFIHVKGRAFYELMDAGLDPDAVCQHKSVNYCGNYTMCHAWGDSVLPPYNVTGVPSSLQLPGASTNIFQLILHILHLDEMFKTHTPIDDDDGDKFAYKSRGLRGTHFRGADCAPNDKRIHPGTIDRDAKKDWNCNGVFGTNPVTRRTYESEWCNSTYYDLVIIGDSIGAHFEAPPRYFLPRGYTAETFDDFLPKLEDELCVPHSGWITGFEDNRDYLSANYFGTAPTSRKQLYNRRVQDEHEWLNGAYVPDLGVETDSIYMRMRDRNRCTHRQYQNCAVSGAKAMDNELLPACSFNKDSDIPVLLTMEFVGNDVCSTIPGFEVMTTVEDYRQGILSKLEYLDQVLPRGSKVVVMGLFDHALHWDALVPHRHPMGMSFRKLFEFLSCMKLAPCWGYMHPDPAVRQKTADHAHSLTLGLLKLHEEKKHAFSFEWHAMPMPVDEIVKRFRADGGTDLAMLFEAVDGFHMNQLANNYVAKIQWDELMATHPDWLGEVNPHNQEIENKFGNQGGYYY